jgi:hypothetical protein
MSAALTASTWRVSRGKMETGGQDVNMCDIAGGTWRGAERLGHEAERVPTPRAGAVRLVAVAADAAATGACGRLGGQGGG